jgi:predicted Zn finger-like uncharacterized protein
MRISCPHCDTSYPIERTCIKAEAGVQFTIICSVCGKDFDGIIHEQVGSPEIRTVIKGTPAVYKTIPGVPASTLYQWTGGLFGVPPVSERREFVDYAVDDQTLVTPAVPSSLVISTRKR